MAKEKVKTKVRGNNMRKWLYNPADEYKGKIFEGATAIAEAKADGWEEAPYSDMVVEIPIKVADPEPPVFSPTPAPEPEHPDFIPVKAWDNEVKPPKPGRKPHAFKAGKDQKDHK